MKNILITLFLFLVSTNTYAFDEGKTIAEELNGTWRIKNVQKMQGLVIRTEKYTKDGGDPKAYISRLKGCTITFNLDSSVVLVTANGKRTIEGKWYYYSARKHKVGANPVPGQFTHTEEIDKLIIKFPKGSSYNIEGEFRDHQFGVVKVKGNFAVIDPKYMFKFQKVDSEDGEAEAEDDDGVEK